MATTSTAEVKGPLEVNTDLCRALGLDPTMVRSIRIEVRPGEFPKVTVDYRFRDAIADEWTTEVGAAYRLVPIEEIETEEIDG